MRAFTIFFSLVAIAAADQLGYDYQPVDHSDAGLSFQPGSSSANYGAPGSSFGAPGSSYGAPGSRFGAPGSSYGAPGISSGAANLSPAIAPAAEFQKDFYSYSAPEADFDDDQAAQQAASSLRQNLRVVFIRNPENRGLENAALALARQAGEQRTAIYVLNKQTDIGDLANKLNVARSQNNQKPEVHFVKYRTPEDAANAQRAIQSQYDGLGGSSQSHNGGVAPVLNFASAAPARAGPAPQAPGNAYLPSSIFRLRL